MRDPNRIQPLLREFAALWQKNPDLRFGQLIEILRKHSDALALAPFFYIEDDKMLDAIKDLKEYI